AIARLAQTYQKDAVRIATTSGEQQHADITYQAMMVANHDGEGAIINVLRYHEAPNAIVFCNTRAMVNRITTRLSNRGFPVVALSGELTQSERSNALQAMRDGRARVCVATDVAARGIDLPNLDLVIHAELPSNHETLLHRSGRTGRAGRKGTSVLIATPKVRSKATRILRGAKLEADWVDAPSADAVRAADAARLFSDPMWTDPVSDSEAEMVGKLADGFTPEQLAAAVLRMQGARHSAPEHLSPVTGEKTPRGRAAFGPSVWFSVTGGRAQGVEVRRLLPTLCNAGDITKDDIGAIRIQDDMSYVEILATSADGFAKALGDMKIEGGATVARLDGVPDAASQPRPKFAPKPKRDFADKPKRGFDGAPKSSGAPKRASTPKPAATKQTDSAPIQSDDAPTPRKRKPKPGTPSKPRSPKPATPMDKAIKDGAVTPAKKPRHKSKGAGKSGAAPKVGKPNSKKNKARRAAAVQGGGQPPRRRG
ncbi:MAG: helicase-related protein, partial [Pseudomonadota bacterium]